MQHFVIELNYLALADRIAQTVAAHRAHMQSGVDQGLILCSGPQTSGDGGIIVARADSLATLEAFFAIDPYQREGLAGYRYIEFKPLRHQPLLADWAAQR